MIHDLDVVLAFVRSPVAQVASGVSVLSSSEDIANARIRFENGCVANLTVSRISPERMRKIRVFSAGEEASYISWITGHRRDSSTAAANSEETPSSFWVQLLASRKKDFKVVSEFAGRKIVREPVPIDKDERRSQARESLSSISLTASKANESRSQVGLQPKRLWSWRWRSRHKFRQAHETCLICKIGQPLGVGLGPVNLIEIRFREAPTRPYLVASSLPACQVTSASCLASSRASRAPPHKHRNANPMIVSSGR